MENHKGIKVLTAVVTLAVTTSSMALAPTPTPLPPSATPSAGPCYTASNFTHVLAGRAHLVTTTLHAAANGSNQDLGFDNYFVVTKLRGVNSNYWVIDSSCP